jgi:hypothetical protein
MKFRVEETCGVPDAIFEDEIPPKSYILSSFLGDASWSEQMFIDMIDLGLSSKNEKDIKVTGLTCDSIDIDIYSDRAVIEHLWLEAEDAKPSSIEMPLEELRQLLLDWQIALKKWKSERK